MNNIIFKPIYRRITIQRDHKENQISYYKLNSINISIILFVIILEIFCNKSRNLLIVKWYQDRTCDP
jgi:hypothetical protein